MKYIIDTEKTVAQAAKDLEAAVTKHSFGVLHTYNLKEILKSKGIDFPQECQIFEICNPKQAVAVLTEDMDMNVALPCRISIWQDTDGKVKIGMIPPKSMLEVLSDSPVIKSIAEEVEASMKLMIDDAK